MDKYWIASSSAFFNSANWSLSSGGLSDTVTPGSEDAAHFDNNGLGDCTLNTSMNIYSLDTDPGYSGTIDQSGRSIGITDYAHFHGGRFIGRGANISIGGYLHLHSVDFTNTDQTLSLKGVFINENSFHDSSGTFESLLYEQTFYPGDCTFNNLQFKLDSTCTYQWINEKCCVKGQLGLLSGTLRAGADCTIHSQGNILCNDGYGAWSPINDMPIIMDGSGIQKFYAEGGIISHLIIEKPNKNQAIVKGSKDVYINGDLIINDGTFNLNNHNVTMM